MDYSRNDLSEENTEYYEYIWSKEEEIDKCNRNQTMNTISNTQYSSKVMYFGYTLQIRGWQNLVLVDYGLSHECNSWMVQDKGALQVNLAAIMENALLFHSNL